MEAAMAELHGPRLFATDTYEDITPQLRKQAAALGLGGVKQVAGARMFDSLPAFQIGVEKLDTGAPAEFRSLDDEVDAAERAFPLDGDASCAVVMDLLKRAEMAWHSGNSGLQTLLACLLVERELRCATAKHERDFTVPLAPTAPWTPAALIKVYVWTVIRAMALSMQLVDRDGHGVVFPEEDFHSMRYDLYFLDDVPVQTVVELAEQAGKAARSQGLAGVAARLGAQAVWLTVLNQRVPKKATNLQRMAELIAAWDARDEPGHAAAFAAWFTRGAQARTSMACLRHPLQPLAGAEARAQWQRIVDAITALLPLNTVQRSTELLGLLLAFSTRQEPALVRAMLKSRFSESQALGQSTKHWALADIAETVAAPPGMLAAAAARAAFDQFAGQAALCYADLAAAFAMNRCRLREALGALVVSFDSLQVSAEQTDAVLAQGAAAAPAVASTWTLFRKLQIMVWIVLMGVETQVVSYAERGYTYWYAAQLGQHQLRHLQRMRQGFEHTPGGRSAPGYGYLAALELEAQMLQQLCTAQQLVWIVLHRLHPPRAVAHLSPDTRFRLRFRMFESVGVPEMPTLAEFDQFQAHWDAQLALQGAANAARTARTLLQTLRSMAAENAEMLLLQRSAAGLLLAVAKLVKQDAPPAAVDVETKDYHPYFPVPTWT